MNIRREIGRHFWKKKGTVWKAKIHELDTNRKIIKKILVTFMGA
jgi:hypothetical protein